MAENRNSSIEGYYAAINWFFANNPHMVDYVTSLGAPKSDRRCDRAMVVAGADGVARLYVNDDFLKAIGPAQAAGVLAHEWRHVLLGHLKETANPKKQWSHRLALRDTHEVVINDSLELTGYELPADVVTGEHRGGHFYGYWGTDEAYPLVEEWYLAQNPNAADQDDSEESQQEGDQGSGSSGAAGSSSSQGDSSGQQSSSGGPDGAQSSPEDSSPGSEDPEGSSDPGQNQKSQDDSEDDSSDQKGAESSSAANTQDSDGTDSDGQSDGAAVEGDSDSEEETGKSCGHGVFKEGEDGELREMDEHEFNDFIDKLNEAIADAISSKPMPDEEKPSETELDAMDQNVAAAIDPSRNQGFSRAGTAASAAEQILAGGKLSLGWLKLLQRINPEVGKADGGLNAKASYNWARPRRTTSLIRGAMLPSAGDPRGRGAGTKQKPVALIALDFSDSVPRKLARALKDMAQSIPEEHIEARCFTFSTEAIPFDFKAKTSSVAAGGTDFSCIEIEARKIQKETGEYPYVICLTDGEAWFRTWGDSAPATHQLADRWLWVDIETEKDEQAFTGRKAYPQVKAQTNKVALPYDRSKL